MANASDFIILWLLQKCKSFQNSAHWKYVVVKCVLLFSCTRDFFLTRFQPPWSFTDLYRLSNTRKCPLSDLAERLSNRDGLKANRHLLGSWHTQIHLQRFNSSRRSLAVWPNSAAVHTILLCSNFYDCCLSDCINPIRSWVKAKADCTTTLYYVRLYNNIS